MKVLLTIILGENLGMSTPFDTPRSAEVKDYPIGRGSDSAFRVKRTDHHMSRHHFSIELRCDRVMVRDRNSSNGTFVNGSRVTDAILADGDEIAAGETTFRVNITGEGSAIGTRPHTIDMDLYGSNDNRPTLEQLAKLCLGCRSTYIEAESPESPVDLCVICRDEMADSEQWTPDYYILRPLGQGGMGSVSLALRAKDKLRVALKTGLDLGSGWTAVDKARFLREGEILSRLMHRNIVAFLEAGENQGRYYLAMEYVEGQDAAKILDTSGPFEIERVFSLATQLLEAVDYAHAKGLIHRDIKPNNLLITRVRNEERLKLADFGLARFTSGDAQARLTNACLKAGHFPFVAPEQLQDFAAAEQATDQYAIAATLYYLLTGHYLFDTDGSVPEMLHRIVHEPPIPVRQRRPEISEGLASWIHKGLAKNPNQRFRNLVEMHRDLERIDGLLKSHSPSFVSAR